MTNQNSCTGNENPTKNWKNKLDLIWKDFDSRSWRNKSHLILRSISWDLIENKFSQSTMKSWSHEVRWMKKIEVAWKNVFCVLEWCEKFKFYYFDKFSHFTHFDEMKILRNSITILSTLTNLTQTLTLSFSSCYPKIKCANEDHGIENEGLYIKYRWRVAQELSNKWFITLRKHYSTFTLATINAPFQYPALADG